MRVLKLIIYIILSFVCIIMSNDMAVSQEKNMPWNADVYIADENIKMHMHSGHQKVNPVNVFNAPQGCAYFLIRGFQIFISPQDGPNCGFRPTCSAYGKIAVLKHGAIIGSFLAGDRLIRCNPYNQPGSDPVPESIFK